MRRQILAAVAALVAAGCHGTGPTEPPVVSFSGEWTGTATDGTIVDVVVSPPAEAGLVGCVRFGFDPVHRPADRIIVPISGTRTESTVSLGTDPGTALAWTFDGTWDGADLLPGSEILDGGPATQLRLSRADRLEGC